MSAGDDTTSEIADVLLAAVVALGALATVHLALPFEAALRPVFVLPLLVVFSGYAVVAALFPARADVAAGHAERSTIDWYERVVLSVSLSVAISVIVGVTLDFTVWPIVLSNVVSIVAGITLAAVLVAAVRRRSLPPAERFSFRRDVVEAGATGGSSRLRRLTTPTNAAVVFAVLLTFGSVVAVTATPRVGETDTDLGLLTRNDDGTIDAENYPREIQRGQPQELVLSVQNRERETVTYTTVVTLDRVAERGEVLRSAELSRFQLTVNHSEAARYPHTVRPTYAGERLRLTYLVYRGDPPAQPSVENAYREVHLWVDVPDSAAADTDA